MYTNTHNEHNDLCKDVHTKNEPFATICAHKECHMPGPLQGPHLSYFHSITLTPVQLSLHKTVDFLMCVDLHVSGELILPTEPGFALIATERFLASVGSHV